MVIIRAKPLTPKYEECHDVGKYIAKLIKDGKPKEAGATVYFCVSCILFKFIIFINPFRCRIFQAILNFFASK